MKWTRSKQLQSIGSALLIFGVLINSCARPGDDGVPKKKDSDDSTKPPTERDDRNTQQTTPVGLVNFDALGIEARSCRHRVAMPSISVSDAPFVVDGDLSDWQDTPVFLHDPLTDGGDNGDIVAVKLARHHQSIFGATRINAAAADTMHVEIDFGRLNEEEASINHELLRRYKIDSSGLRQWDAESQEFLAADPTRGIGVFGAEGVEWRIPLVLLEGVLYQPLWGMQVRLYSDGELIDQTMVRYAKNILSSSSQIEVGLCLAVPGDESSFHFIEVYKPSQTESPDDIERAFNIVRTAHTTVQTILNRPHEGVAGLTVLLSDRAQEQPPFFHQEGGQVYNHGALVIDVTIFERDVFADALIFKQAAVRFIDLYLDLHVPDAPEYLRTAWHQYLTDHVIKTRLGKAYWLNHWRLGVRGFLSELDTAQPQNLALRLQELLEVTEEQRDSTWKKKYQAYLGKSRGLGHILVEHIPLQNQLRIFQELKELKSELNRDVFMAAFHQVLADNLGEQRRDLVRSLWAGWLDGDVYHEGFSPLLLNDDDFDGLPNYLELAFGSNPNLADTDGDGWSDFAEYVAGTDPRSFSSHPGAIVADNYFGDWQVMLPDRVVVDVGTSATGCPAGADITHYAGLATAESLIIGAVAKDFWREPPHVRWEADLELTTSQGKKSYTLRTVSGQYEYEILDSDSRELVQRFYQAMPLGVNVMEWMLDRRQLRLPEDFSFTVRGAVRFRLKTVFERAERMFCDDTEWILPLVSQ